MAQDSSNIEYLYDFAYLDRGRVDFYFAQLFEDGVLTQTKRTARDSSTETTRMGASVKIVSGDHTGADLVERGLERLFDPSWLAPVEVLNRLDELQFVHRELNATPIGGLFMIRCEMSVIDIRMLKELWSDIGEMVLHQEVASQNLAPKPKQQAIAAGKRSSETVAKVLKNMPHSVQATFTSNGSMLWSTLRPESMLINPDDLALKHGATIPGSWYLLGVLDAQPGEGRAPIYAREGGLDTAMVQMLSAMRELMGRPSSAYGVTPIGIFRAVRPIAGTQ